MFLYLQLFENLTSWPFEKDANYCKRPLMDVNSAVDSLGVWQMPAI